MNIQELQTIVHNKLSIIIFVMNIKGYHSIWMTQKNYFGETLVGVGPESNDLSFHDLCKFVPAYGIRYRCCNRLAEINLAIDWPIKQENAYI